jgi:hypothetical protein
VSDFHFRTHKPIPQEHFTYAPHDIDGKSNKPILVLPLTTSLSGLVECILIRFENHITQFNIQRNFNIFKTTITWLYSYRYILNIIAIYNYQIITPICKDLTMIMHENHRCSLIFKNCQDNVYYHDMFINI